MRLLYGPVKYERKEMTAVTDDEFSSLLSRCRSAAERYVRFRVYSNADADDILAETYAAAWMKKDQIKDVEAFRAWLISIARSKCSDHLRSAQKRDEREEPSPDIAERSGRLSGIDGVYTAVQETMSLIPHDKSQLLYMAYWLRLPQSEIAERMKIPVGTVKSRMSAARDEFRKAYVGHVRPEKENTMKKNRLPEILPEYSIRYTGDPFPVVCEELMGWFAVPKPGEKLSWAMYDLPSRKMDMAYTIEAGEPAEVHGIPGREMIAKGFVSDDYDAIMEEPVAASGASADEWRFAAQLTDTHSRFLAAAHREDGVMKFRTFLDGDEFLDNWGIGEDNRGFETHLKPKGLISRGGNVIKAEIGRDIIDLVGRYEVVMNGRSFDTVCLMDIGSYVGGVVSEQYIGRDGRTVLWRRFNSDGWHSERYGGKWSKLLPDNERLIVNGETFVHWYDCITDRIMI